MVEEKGGGIWDERGEGGEGEEGERETPEEQEEQGEGGCKINDNKKVGEEEEED